MEEAECLSPRTLRYGRNIMVICFIASAVEFFAADFSGASLFGIKVQEQQFWLVVLLLLIWHLVYFVVLVNDDIQNWWDKNITGIYPTSKFVTYLQTPPKTIVVGKRTYTFTNHPSSIQWKWQQGKTTEYLNIQPTAHKQTRRTILRVMMLDGGFPVVFSVFTILLVVREWLTLAFWKFVVETFFG